MRIRLCARVMARVCISAAIAAAFHAEDGRAQIRKSVVEPRAVSAFELATLSGVVTSANQLQCGVWNNGSMCGVDLQQPTSESGYWPKGTANANMYTTGIRVMGIIRPDASCDLATKRTNPTPKCFAWSGDTTGAWFDPEYAREGTPLTRVYDSRNATDLAAWPTEGTLPDFPFVSGIISDTSIFNAALIGAKSASDQDTWTAYWDGDTTDITTKRTHPMGVLVEQRSMAWNLPEGNAATIYYVLRITNVTNNPLFQKINEAMYFGGKDSLPNDGWRFDSVFITQTADQDAGNPTSDLFTPIVPFSMGVMYDSRFQTDGNSYEYPPAFYHTPFFPNAPGFAAVKFLRAPRVDSTQTSPAISMATAYTSGGLFTIPPTPPIAWRQAAMKPIPADRQCNVAVIEQARVLHTCFVPTAPAELKSGVSTGPFSLEPGKSEILITSVITAAAVSTPLIIPGGISTPNKPGTPSIAPGCGATPIRPIEVAAGWIATVNCPASPNAVLDGRNVTTVHESLLGKAATAQEMVDHKFVMPMAPAAPAFYVIPGDNRVTVVWDPSTTEKEGDAFYQWTSDPANALYDPNYRKFDVEGYRIYRGTTPSNLTLVAQFDKNNSVFTDSLCVTDSKHETGSACGAVVSQPISGDLIQYRSVILGANGSTQVLVADTVGNDAIREGKGLPLSDTGIPFAYTDTTVRSGFTYYYAVSAFDVNSVRTSPSSVESGAAPQVVRPRAVSNALNGASIETGLAGRNGVLVQDSASTIDRITGEFSGPQPATSGLTGTFTTYAAQLLARGAHDIRIDSVVPIYYTTKGIAKYYFTADGVQQNITVSNATVGASSPSTPGQQGSLSESTALPVSLLATDAALRNEWTAKGVDAPSFAAALNATITVDQPLLNSLLADWAFKQPSFWFNAPPKTTWAGGSRWFSGANESMPDPAYGVVAHGQLDGVSAIFQPVPYRGLVSPAGATNTATTAMAGYRGTNGTLLNENVFRRFYTSVLGVTRGADVRFYWGAPSASGAATLDSVIDVTHDVAVPFSSAVRASYGFLQDADGDGKLTYGDFYYLEGLETVSDIAALTSQKKPLLTQPSLVNVDVTGDLVADGTGFGLYVDGEPYIFQVTALPTNTVWTLRTYNGVVARDSLTGYSFTSVGGNPAVPGLRLLNTVVSPATIVAANADLSKVHTVPDPYYANSLFDESATTRQLQFVNLPARADVRIYSLSGVLVDILIHDDVTGGGKETWDLRTRNGKFVASGVYLFHVLTPEGRTTVGKFTVIGPPN